MLVTVEHIPLASFQYFFSLQVIIAGYLRQKSVFRASIKSFTIDLLWLSHLFKLVLEQGKGKIEHKIYITTNFSF